MRIGISQASYAWILAGDSGIPEKGSFMWARLPLDSPEYVWTGLPHPFFFSTPLSFAEGQGLLWLIERCGELGIQAINGGNRRLRRDPIYRAQILALLKERGIELVAGGGMDLVTDGAAAEEGRRGFAESIRLAAEMGCRILATAHAGRVRNYRFTKDPPLAKQLELITENFKHMVEIAEECRVIIAFENHMDYRACEVAEVIERVNSPYLRANFDTANSLAVAEDPVDGARCVAPYTVMTHFKDFLVQPMSVDGLPKFFNVPLGHGHVDLEAILDILWKKAPDPEGLPLCMEVYTPFNVDADVWVREGVKFLREECGRFLSKS